MGGPGSGSVLRRQTTDPLGFVLQPHVGVRWPPLLNKTGGLWACRSEDTSDPLSDVQAREEPDVSTANGSDSRNEEDERDHRRTGLVAGRSDGRGGLLAGWRFA